MTQRPFWISPGDSSQAFPDVSLALKEPDGLLAVGGDLSSARILAAYRNGIFPWYSDNQPILWWSPDPRTVLYPAALKVSRSLRKRLRQRHFELTLDKAFRQVIQACAGPRRGSEGTWITDAMTDAYCRLHEEGHAHSVECWSDGKLVGGLYGVAIGQVFFGESMFSRMTDASKVAFCHLVVQLEAWKFGLVDCQVYSPHLASLGAQEISRTRFIDSLQHLCRLPAQVAWQFDDAVLTRSWS